MPTGDTSRNSRNSRKTVQEVRLSSKWVNNKKRKKTPITIIEHLDTLLARKMNLSPNTTEVVGSPIVYARLRTCEGQEPHVKTIRVLLDSGASATLIKSKLVEKLPRTRTKKPVRWKSLGGVFRTKTKCQVQFTLPEFLDQKLVTWQACVDEGKNDLWHDMIIGRDL